MLKINLSIVWTIINLLILYWLLKKFLFGRVRNIIKQREEQIKKSYDDAAAVRKDADEMKARYTAQLEDAEAAAAKLKADARRKADAEYDRIVAEANGRSDEIIAAAQKKAKAAAEQEKRDAEEKITGMVKDAAAKIVESQTDEQMYDVFLKEVRDTDTEGSKTE